MADLAKLVDELSALTVMEAADLSKMLEEKIEKETIDITLPATKIQRGSKHPVNRVIEEIEPVLNGASIYIIVPKSFQLVYS